MLTKMKMLAATAVLVSAPMITTAASATTTVATYDFAAIFTEGPNPLITGTITLSYDPAATNSPVGITDFRSTVFDSYTPVTVSNIFYGSLGFGNACDRYSCDVYTDQKGFSDYFSVDSSGNVTGDSGVYYSDGNSAYSSRSQSITREIPVVAAVPEPATWLTMILGFGLVGGALRRRRQKVTTRVAFA